MTLHPFTVAFAFVLLATSALNAQARNDEPKLPGQVVRLEAGEFFIKAPDTVSAGLTTFVLHQVGDMLNDQKKTLAASRAPVSPENDPTRAFHMVWVMRLDSGHTVNEWYGATLKGEKIQWATNVGGPSFAEPPGATNATMVLRPGNYVLVCYVGSARDDKKRYHLMNGMFKPLTVRPASANTQALPRGDVSAVISGTGQVTLNGTLRRGTQSILVTNETAKAIEFTVHRIKTGRSATETLTWRRAHGTDYPFESVGGFSDVPPGESLLTTISFEPGTYLLWTSRSPGTSVTVTIPGT